MPLTQDANKPDVFKEVRDTPRNRQVDRFNKQLAASGTENICSFRVADRLTDDEKVAS